MKLPENHAKVSRLCSKLLDGELAEPGLRDLEKLLRDDPEARLLYLQYIDMQVEFMCLADPADALAEIPDLTRKAKAKNPREEKPKKTLPKPPKPVRTAKTSSRRKRKPKTVGGDAGRKIVNRDWWVAGALAAGIAIMIGVGVLLNRPESGGEVVEEDNPIPAQPVSVDRVSGEVAVTRQSGDLDTAPQPGLKLERDDFIQVADEDADAMLTYADGTRFRIVRGAAIRPLPGPGKQLELPHGDAWFSVTPQPAEQPLVIDTPVAKVEVLGTEFLLTSSDAQTELAVTSGRVRLTRHVDGESYEVPAGERLVAPRVGRFVSTALWDADYAWREDFENGIPKGWKGKFVDRDLLPGSRGAITSTIVKEKDGKHYRIACEGDKHGLFDLHEDTHLHIVYRIDRNSWWNFFLFTQPKNHMHRLKEDRFQEVVGKWRKAVIPFNRFERKGKDHQFHPSDPPAPGEHTSSFFVDTVNTPQYLTIDSIWVTRGGPGVTEFMTLE